MALQRRRGGGRRGEDGQRYGQPQPRRPAVRRPAGGPLRQGGGERYCRLVQQSFFSVRRSLRLSYSLCVYIMVII